MSEVSDPELLKQLNDPSTAVGGGDPTIPSVPGQMKLGDEMDLLRGVGQGLIDPVEGLAQLAEHIAGRHLAPDALRQWAKDFRNKAQSTYLGIGGEVAGNVAGLAIPGGMLGKTVTTAGKIAQGIGEGAISGALQPVTGGGDYASTKARQGVLGAITGGAGPAAVGAAGKVLPYLPIVGHPIHGILHMLGRSNMPSSTLGNLAQRVPPTAYGSGAGIYRGTHPTPADQPASNEDRPAPPPAPPATAPRRPPPPPVASEDDEDTSTTLPADFAERFRAARGQQKAEDE